MSIKYVFLDIDGTLLNYEARIPASALEALNEAHRRGHRLIVCTGRQRLQIPAELLEQVPFDGIVACSGAHIEHGGKVIYESAWCAQELCEVLDYLDREGAIALAYTHTGPVADPRFEARVLPYMRGVGFSEDLIRTAYGNIRVTEDLRDEQGVEKVFYFLSDKTTEQVSADLKGHFFVTDYSVGELKSDKYYGEITQLGVTKSEGMRRYMVHVGGSVEDTVAVGDSGNDIDIILAAGIGVAMGNGTEAIKQAADLVTTDIDDDGIKNAFERLGLI